MDLERAEQEGVTQCLLLPGEIIVVPDNWWHATCNLLPYTVAMGAQLWVEPRRYDLRSPPAAVDVPDGTRGLNPFQKTVVPTLTPGTLLGGSKRMPPQLAKDEL